MSSKSLKIFLSHAHEDKEDVQQLYHSLVAKGIDAWFDSESLLGGQNWKYVIEESVRGADVVIVCLTSTSVNKEGYIQKEIKIALEAYEEKPDNTIFVIPVKLSACSIPTRLKQFHCINLFEQSGYEKLMRTLTKRAKDIGKSFDNNKHEINECRIFIESFFKDVSSDGESFGHYLRNAPSPSFFLSVSDDNSSISIVTQELEYLYPIYNTYLDKYYFAAEKIGHSIIKLFRNGRVNIFCECIRSRETRLGYEHGPTTVIEKLERGFLVAELVISERFILNAFSEFQTTNTFGEYQYVI